MDNEIAETPPETSPDNQMAEESGPMAENELCVSLDALAMPDEHDKSEAPAVGDKVQAMVEGEVSRIVGYKAYVTMSAVNGQPVEATPEAPTEADNEASMREMASNQPPY